MNSMTPNSIKRYFDVSLSKENFKELQVRNYKGRAIYPLNMDAPRLFYTNRPFLRYFHHLRLNWLSVGEGDEDLLKNYPLSLFRVPYSLQKNSIKHTGMSNKETALRHLKALKACFGKKISLYLLTLDLSNSDTFEKVKRIMSKFRLENLTLQGPYIPSRSNIMQSITLASNSCWETKVLLGIKEQKNLKYLQLAGGNFGFGRQECEELSQLRLLEKCHLEVIFNDLKGKLEEESGSIEESQYSLALANKMLSMDRLVDSFEDAKKNDKYKKYIRERLSFLEEMKELKIFGLYYKVCESDAWKDFDGPIYGPIIDQEIVEILSELPNLQEWICEQGYSRKAISKKDNKINMTVSDVNGIKAHANLKCNLSIFMEKCFNELDSQELSHLSQLEELDLNTHFDLSHLLKEDSQTLEDFKPHIVPLLDFLKKMENLKIFRLEYSMLDEWKYPEEVLQAIDQQVESVVVGLNNLKEYHCFHGYKLICQKIENSA